jgi:hypothetical protein
MALFKYSYNKKTNISNLKNEIESNLDITIGLYDVIMSANDTIVSMKDDLEIQVPDQKVFLDQIVNDHIYEDPVNESEYKTDNLGKIVTHQTLREDGYTTYFTGRGDDPDDVDNVGDGEEMAMQHLIGEPLIQDSYIDFNCINNKSYLYEGYISYDNAKLDCISMSIVPRVTGTTTGTNTFYNLHNGYLIVPAAGDGTTDITSDITSPTGGLVYMPTNDDGTLQTAFWNADWDDVNKVFINITAAPLGDGRYNMFAIEVPLVKFVNRFHFTGMGTQELDSEDTDELGHGMRVKLTSMTHGNDHDWTFAASFTMHRTRTT